MRLSNDIWDWSRFCRGSNSEKSETELLNRLEYFDKFCRQFDFEKIYPKDLQNDIYHRSRLCRVPNSEKVKMALSLELNGIL